MSYKLLFKTAARKEWDKLDTSLRIIFKKRLREMETNN
jgi:mRNA-degrading endonuclease RelE of RelBE toxin-antitoxin system